MPAMAQPRITNRYFVSERFGAFSITLRGGSRHRPDSNEATQQKVLSLR